MIFLHKRCRKKLQKRIYKKKPHTLTVGEGAILNIFSTFISFMLSKEKTAEQLGMYFKL